MNYSAKQYAAALHSALKDADDNEKKEIIRRFYFRLGKDHKLKLLDGILREFEKIDLKEGGARKVLIESVSPVSEEYKKSITDILGGRVVLEEKLNPALLGGVSILLDEETLIDASLKKHLSNLFNKPKTI